jgi:hypothetical protein
MSVRKIVVHRELIQSDAFGEPCSTVTRVAALGVVANPLAGRFERDLSPLFDLGREVGERLVAEALPLLQKPVLSYGKAAIVGVNGDLEHGGAMIHPKLGAPMRAAVGGGRSVIPSNAKIGPAGTTIDIPLGHKDDPWSFDHFDTLTVVVADAPLPDEIVLCVAYADGGRPHARCGSGPITT